MNFTVTVSRINHPSDAKIKYLLLNISYFEDILIKYAEDNFSGDKRFYIINPHTNMGLTFAPWPRWVPGRWSFTQIFSWLIRRNFNETEGSHSHIETQGISSYQVLIRKCQAIKMFTPNSLFSPLLICNHFLFFLKRKFFWNVRINILHSRCFMVLLPWVLSVLSRSPDRFYHMSRTLAH